MSWYTIITVIHAVSAAVGVGAAAASDSVFLASIRNRKINHDQFLLIRRSSAVVLGGLTVLVLTGIALVLMNPDLWAFPHFRAKMTVVIVLIINGLVFHARVIPSLEQYQHTTMPEHIIASKQWLLAITGAVSGVSWISALIIAVIGDIGLRYFVYMGFYAFLMISGSLVAYFLLAHIVFRIGSAESEAVKSAREQKDEKASLMLLSALLLLLIIALVIVVVVLF